MRRQLHYHTGESKALSDHSDGHQLRERRRRKAGGLGAIAVLGIIAFALVLSGTVSRAASRETVVPARPEGRFPSAPWPGIYAFLDYRHLDPAEYPLVGGYYIFNWADIEPAQDEYHWDLIDGWLEAEAGLGKPAAIAFTPYNGVCCGGNEVPSWLFELEPESWVFCDEAYDDDWAIPRYWHEGYLAHYNDFLRAAGERYDNDPRLTWVGIGTGMYCETWPAENQGAADYTDCLLDAGLTSDLWVQTVNRITDMHAQAFPNTPLLLQFAPAFKDRSERIRFTDYAAQKGIGLKHNGLQPDSGDAVWDSGEGQYDPMFKWGEQVALGWESYNYLMPGEAGTLWGIYSGLNKHADYMVLAAGGPDDVIMQEARRPILEFANAHLGRTLDDTPSVWVALRETEREGPHLYPQLGNYDFWLYQRDDAPAGRTVPEWNISAHKEGRYTRRSDEATGNPYMVFDVDDGYLHEVGQGETISLTVVYYDEGRDTWELQYDAWGGAYKSGGVIGKGDSGHWLSQNFVLEDALFANRQSGGGDFRLWSRGDGDEYIHFVQVAR
ncbi:MAG TPA: hypothetical protein VM537_29430, partial [Anaerolineae bacterium]|nr:hypothetical protein [Anaerolineae bacterium]